MNLSELRENQRYLFHYKNKNLNDNSETMFRANFVKLFVHEKWNSLIVNNYESNKYPNESKKTWWSIDTNMIESVENLPNILGNSCLLPEDVLLEIDNYY
jgi:hypothetical protein